MRERYYGKVQSEKRKLTKNLRVLSDLSGEAFQATGELERVCDAWEKRLGEVSVALL